MAAAGFRINTNTTATSALRLLNRSQGDLERSIERLSSGMRINRAADDTAGLAISQRMRAEIKSLQQASQNASQSVNLIQTAEGGLNEIHNLLIRMRELAIQSASVNVGASDRSSIDLEFSQLRSEIDRIATSTEYNRTALIDGSFGGNSVSFGSSNTSQTLTTNGLQQITLSGASTGTYTITDAGGDGALTLSDGTITQTVTFTTAPASGQTIRVNFTELGAELRLNDAYDDGDLNAATFEVVAGNGGELQIGANNTADNQMSFIIGDSTAGGLSLNASSVSNLVDARAALDELDTAITLVNVERGTLGALQNRLEFAISNLDNISENVQAAESTIRDADFAAETANFTRAQILVQSGTAMLAQANAISQNVLSLLG